MTTLWEHVMTAEQSIAFAEEVARLGYYLKEFKDTDNASIWFVRAYNPNNLATPHVTWAYNAERNSLFSGNYFQEEKHAIEDFKKRQ